MYSYTIDTREIDAFAKAMEALPEATAQEATIAMRQAVAEVERQAEPRTPVNVGTLAGAWTTKVTRGTRVVKGEVINPKEYAIVMEKGRRAGAKMPPLGPIAYWLYRKGIVTDRREIRSAAYLVARSIARKGIKGHFMLRDGLKAAEPVINRTFEKVPQKVWDKVT